MQLFATGYLLLIISDVLLVANNSKPGTDGR